MTITQTTCYICFGNHKMCVVTKELGDSDHWIGMVSAFWTRAHIPNTRFPSVKKRWWKPCWTKQVLVVQARAVIEENKDISYTWLNTSHGGRLSTKVLANGVLWLNKNHTKIYKCLYLWVLSDNIYLYKQTCYSNTKHSYSLLRICLLTSPFHSPFYRL